MSNETTRLDIAEEQITDGVAITGVALNWRYKLRKELAKQGMAIPTTEPVDSQQPLTQDFIAEICEDVDNRWRRSMDDITNTWHKSMHVSTVAINDVGKRIDSVERGLSCILAVIVIGGLSFLSVIVSMFIILAVDHKKEINRLKSESPVETTVKSSPIILRSSIAKLNVLIHQEDQRESLA